ncbi:MAG: lipid IV(A) 3-deoxy-D-manno-octulosonic acid transferase [Methylophilaceae bacterium]|nr:lipid IV(A) 3-deoxy-D-manno-octulosonic acid transferase [Methylophilaceae bacterium]
MTRMIYTFLLYILLPFTPIKLLLRGIKQSEYRQDWGERFGFYAAKNTSNKKIIWLHCVSVGETRAAEPLVKALLLQYPQHQIILSHTTPTGRATSEALFGDSVSRVYLPYDVPFAVRRFLNHFSPVVGVLMETELWFNLIAECKNRNVPLLLINARLSERSMLGYKKIYNLANEGLNNLTTIAAQTQEDAERLQNLGAKNTSVMGNLKFDVTPPYQARNLGLALRELIGKNRPVFLAASTRAYTSENEETFILQALTQTHIPDLLTIIVPRHPQRFDEVAAFLSKQGWAFVRKSTLNKTISSNTNILLGDTMGELFTYYAACDVAFIGGSLLPLGGQNIIEACAMAKPVLIGPHTYNFSNATELAINSGAALLVEDVADLAVKLKYLLSDTNASFERRANMSKAALEFTRNETGATQRAMALLSSVLKS